MSAIGGVFGLDGKPVSEGVPLLARALAHRGPHHAWTRAQIALIACGTQPVVDPATGIVIVADARIDNRAELPAAGPSAAELILAAYREWGSACVPRLLGDFAFAIFDPRRRLVFCARDAMGVKPFYYHHAPQRNFAFATEIKGLLALPHVSRAIDDEAVALFLSTTAVDRVSTFYSNVVRLPAAHTLTVSREGLVLNEYWRVDAGRTLRLGSDRAYAEAFSERFRAAVGARVRDAAPVGATLSGGLDSSSIVCTARQLGVTPLHTFSLVFPGLDGRALRSIDERGYVDQVIAGGGLEPHFVRGDELSPMGDLDRTLWHLDQPFGAPNLYLHLGLYAAAQQAGVRVLLDGFDGDTTVSHGMSRLNDLATAGEWSTFETEIRAFAEHRDIAPAAVLPHFGFPLLATLAAHGRFVKWALAARQLASRFALSRRDVLQRYGLSQLVPGAVTRAWQTWRGWERNEPELLQPALRRRVADRLREAEARARADTIADERSAHLQGLSQPLYQQTLEIADHSAAAFGIEPRFPFFDRQLIEFCVAVPPEQKFAEGWSRLLMRRAMEGVLPPAIQWRGTKSNLSHNFAPRLRAGDGPRLERTGFDALAPYVDVGYVRALRDRVLAGSAADHQLLVRLTMLAQWLERPESARRAA